MSGDAAKIASYTQTGSDQAKLVNQMIDEMGPAEFITKYNTGIAAVVGPVNLMVDSLIRLRTGAAATTDEINNFVGGFMGKMTAVRSVFQGPQVATEMKNYVNTLDKEFTTTREAMGLTDYTNPSGNRIASRNTGDIQAVLPDFEAKHGSTINNFTGIKFSDNKQALLDEYGVRYATGASVPDGTGGEYFVFESPREWYKAQNALWDRNLGQFTLPSALMNWKGVDDSNPNLTSAAAEQYTADILSDAFGNDYKSYLDKSYSELTQFEKENLMLSQLKRENYGAWQSMINDLQAGKPIF